jgi:acetyl esterase/lipase
MILAVVALPLVFFAGLLARGANDYKDNAMALLINQYEWNNYGANGHAMTICYPKNTRNADGSLAKQYPGIVLLHGGGWGGGARLDIIEQTRALARLGVIACSIDYTLATADAEPALPAVMQDISDALSLVASFDCCAGMPVSLGGFSAGGHLALVYAMTHTHALHSLVAVGAPTDMNAWDDYLLFQSGDSTFAHLLGEGYSGDDLLAASPMHLSLDSFSTPVFFAQGGVDWFRDLVDGTPFVHRLADAQKSAHLLLIGLGDHTLENVASELADAAYQYIK